MAQMLHVCAGNRSCSGLNEIYQVSNRMQLLGRELKQHTYAGWYEECGKVFVGKSEHLEKGIHVTQAIEHTQCSTNG